MNKSTSPRELSGHFLDGLESERSENDVLTEFGNLRKAARLIRRSKIRCRPRAWHIWYWSSRTTTTALATLLAIYLFLLIRLFTATPHLAINIKREFNQAQLAIPKADRAWPQYRELAVTLLKNGRSEIDELKQRPSEAEWVEINAYLEKHQDEIRQLRAATRLPRLGYYFGDPRDAEAIVTWINVPKPMISADFEEENPPASHFFPGTHYLSWFAQVLYFDGRRAASAGDGDTVIADALAIVRLAKHHRDGLSSSLNDLFSLRVFGRASDLLSVTLAEQPEVFSDAQLIDLAHQLAGTDPLPADQPVG